MSVRRGFVTKTALTPLEKIKAAYFYEVRGVGQQVLADMFEVNSGRINDAVMDVRKAVGLNGMMRSESDNETD